MLPAIDDDPLNPTKRPNQDALLAQLGGGPSPMAGPSFAPGAPAPGQPPPVDPIQAPKPSLFQSDNRSVGGYLQELAASKRGDLVKIADEAGRKKFAEDMLREHLPELQARGANVGDIRNEKLQIDGRWKDIFRDIEGEAAAQYIEPSDADTGGGGMAMMNAVPMGGVPLDPALQGDPLAAIQQAIAQYSGQRPNMDALLAQLGQ